MVVLTLHRDEPLSTHEITLLPAGCFPVFAQGDIVARAELSLPAAHIARFAADMARAIPDADFIAEERPTAYAVALLEAGALEEPYWAHLPALTFRAEPPGAATLAEGEGTIAHDSPLKTTEHTVPQDQHVTHEMVQSTDFEDLVRRAQELSQQQQDNPTPQLPAPPTEPALGLEPEPIMKRMSLDNLVQQMRSSGVIDDTAQTMPAPQPATQVPSQIMEMFQSIRQQEESTGQVMNIVGDSGHAPPTVTAAVAEPEVAEPGFWDHVAARALEKAETAAQQVGAALPEKERIATLLMDKDPALVVLGLRVSRSSLWSDAGRLLGRLVHHPDSEVRRELAQALRVLKVPNAEADLVILTRDNEISVSDAARAALQRMKKRSRF